MRLIGLKRQDELWDKDGNPIPEHNALPILHEICAQPVPVDDPEVQFMIHRATTEFQYHIDSAVSARERVITRDGQPVSRCSP
ncbi:hypothetical protein ADINL_0438 [Nitrincola lacisaponensis]|uniref:Uncharacterized protein n=2 Tax=Nitrincola lacisaponensis TaxID=267850 RepID=A0A063Y7G5_9GAMM|nr:hypothetical protein ADINL_0438 [Nitrincola lacisaponensis]